MKQKWNVLVYQAGDNNLSEEMIWALQGMRDFLPREGINVFAQLDPLGAGPRTYDFTESSDQPLGPKGVVLSVVAMLKDRDEYVDIADKLGDLVQLGKILDNDNHSGLRNYLQGCHLLSLECDEAHATGLATNDPIVAGSLVDEDATKIWKAKEDLEKLYSLLQACEKDLENSASPAMIKKFAKEHINLADPNHRMLVLSGHGSGAVGDFLKDQNPYSSTNMISFADALEGVGATIDILGMDSCLMSMAEVCHQIAATEKAKFLVGSEGFITNTGWPYEKILTALANMKDREPKEVAEKIVQEYINFYEDYAFAGISVDCAAIQLSEFEDKFIPAFKELSKLLLEKTPADKGLDRFTNVVLLAHWEAQCYNDDQYVDVHDICKLLKRHYVKEFYPDYFDKLDTDEEIKDDVVNAINDVTKSVEEVVLHSCYSGPAFQYSRGISVYFPWGLVDYVDAYDDLEFPKATGWGAFLRKLLWKTQREVRPGVGPKQTAVPMGQPMLVIRKSPPHSKGMVGRAGGTKNHPNEFYGHSCE